jgi:tetratricopeptide (TPR) repeat protein
VNCLIFADNQLFNQQINNNQQASNELQSSREQQANNANDDSLASKSLATESLAKESPELILAEQPTVTTDSQAFKKGSMVAMSSTLSTTLTPHQLSNTVSTVTTSPSRGQLAAALATLLLLGGVGYYFSLPPTSPPPITNNNGANFAISPTTETKAERNFNDLDSPEQEFSQLAMPALIKEIEALVKSQASDQAQKLLTPALKQAKASKDPVAQSKLLYLQGRIYGDKAEFARAIATLKESITIATALNKPELLVQPEVTLASIYHVTDQDLAAATHARLSLALAQEVHDTTNEIISLRLLAISEFFIDKSTKAEELIIQSIKVAQEKLTSAQVVQGYIYLGIIATEKKKFAQAKEHFERALIATIGISDPQRRTYLTGSTNGYYARSQFLAGKSKKSIELYALAIQQANRAGIKQKLALSQLNQGLADSYLAQGDKIQAKEAEHLALRLADEARQSCETNNTALSFAINRQVAKQCN